MYGEKALKEIVKQRFKQYKARHPSHTLRSFAKKLNVSHSTLSKLMKWDKSVTKTSAKQIMCALKVDEHEIAGILKLFDDQIKESPKHKKVAPFATMVEMTDELSELVSEWYYGAIGALVATEGFRAEPEWIAERLGLPMETAQKALDTLVKLGIFTRETSGEIKARQIDFIIKPENVPYAKIKRTAIQIHDIAKDNLVNGDYKTFHMVNTTIQTTPEKFKEARRLIDEFMDNLGLYLRAGENTEVYSLAVQLVPLTKKITK